MTAHSSTGGTGQPRSSAGVDPATRPRLVALAAALAVLAAALDVFGPVGSIGLVASAAVAGSLWVPAFWRTVLRGAAAGALTGLVVLGPGLRVAMRIVALADPVQTPELTAEGTAVVLVFAVMIGGMFGVIGALLDIGAALRPSVVAGAMTVFVMIGFLTDPGVRDELLSLGAGPWMNLPLFAAVVYAYARVATALWRRRSWRRQRAISTAPPADVRT